MISDVHAEPTALNSVLDAVDRAAIQRIWCLGDLVGGRGIDPIGVLDRVLERCEVVLAGNHDRIATGHRELLWTASHPGIDRSTTELTRADRLSELAGLPTERELRLRDWSFALAHACPWPFDTMDDYLVRDVAPERIFDARDEHLVLVGHTHVPICCLAMGEQFGPEPGGAVSTTFTIPRSTHAIVNPGSVAPGRDGDGRPTWLELELHEEAITATWHRSGEPAYDVDAV